MITYRFVSQTFLGEPIKVQYSKYSSNIRIDLGSGTFPFEYTTDQKGGTYYFYVPSLDTVYPKTIDIPPIDFYINTLNVPDCDISGFTNNIPSCDIENQIITIPVCDVDYEIKIVTPTPTPTVSTICPSISAVTVGPIEISGGEYTSCLNLTNLLLHQFNSSGLYICDIPSQSDSILPDSLFVDEITVIVPSPYWFGGPCQYCFNINTGELFDCNQVVSSPTPTPSITNTITPTPSITSTITSTITPTPIVTETITQTPSITPTNSLTPTNTQTITQTPSITPSPLCSCITFTNTGATSVTYSGRFCDGSSFINAQPILAGETQTGCFQNITPNVNLNIVRGAECSGGICPTPTPTVTPTNTPTPTVTPTNIT
jgi:hypothetical protein